MQSELNSVQGELNKTESELNAAVSSNVGVPEASSTSAPAAEAAKLPEKAA